MTFGATNTASFHPVRLDPTPTDFTAHDLTGPQWEDLSHDGNTNGTDAGSIDGPVCYTRSGINGTNVTMTLHLNIYAPGANQNGTYKVKATIQAPGEAVFNFNSVAATVGTLQNGVTGKPDTVLTADLTASDLNLPSIIADKTYTIKYSVSTDGGNTWSDAGQSKTICYVTNADPTTSWTYNNMPADPLNPTGPKIDTDTHPLWTTLDIASRACAALNLAVAPGASPQPIIDAIWALFKTRIITDESGKAVLKYWGTPATVNQTGTNLDNPLGLIAYKDGQCGAWAALLVDCLRTEGVAGADVYGVTVNSNAPGAPDGTHTKPIGFVAKSQTAQGNKTTEVSFGNHALVEIPSVNGLIYDPSYGQTYGAPQDWIDYSVYDVVFAIPTNLSDRKEGTPQPFGVADCTFTPQHY